MYASFTICIYQKLQGSPMKFCPNYYPKISGGHSLFISRQWHTPSSPTASSWHLDLVFFIGDHKSIDDKASKIRYIKLCWLPPSISLNFVHLMWRLGLGFERFVKFFGLKINMLRACIRSMMWMILVDYKQLLFLYSLI